MSNVPDGLVQAEQFLVLLSWVEIWALLVGNDLGPSFWPCHWRCHRGRGCRGRVIARVATMAIAIAIAAVAHHAPDGHAGGWAVWVLVDTTVVIAVVRMIPICAGFSECNQMQGDMSIKLCLLSLSLS